MKQTKEILPLQYIKGVGPKRAEAFAASGIHTPTDLLFLFPRAYVDRSAVSSLRALAVKLRQENVIDYDGFSKNFSMNNEVTVLATIKNQRTHTFGRSRKMLTLTLADDSGGTAQIIFWQGAEYFSKMYTEGQIIIVSGKAEIDSYGKITFNHPEIEKIDKEEEEIYLEGGIMPVYRLTETMKSSLINNRQLRKIIATILPLELSNIKEIFPEEFLKKYGYPEIRTCISNLHFPKTHEMIEKSRQRMKFQEIFFFEMFLAVRHNGIKLNEKGIVFNPKSQIARQLFDSLPFSLTGDQKKVIREITDDMKSGRPMNRLLQGDVGSGKTIVAIFGMLVAIQNGYQVAFLAPTEILAEQHFHTLNKFLENLDIKIVQLLGGQRAKVRRDVLEKISTGFANIIVGTHALFESEIVYNSLGLIIIDEQHRFGVAQRAELKKLAQKSLPDDSFSPHVLVMSATPIPRTLSLTVYGDLDVSVIREMPKDRKPIKTKIAFEGQLPAVWDFVREKVKAGRQAFVVYPLVEKSDKMELKSATEHYELLQNEVFPEFKCGLLHGQMFWYEKDETMKAFLNRDYQILVATTVIEVGIDIPNATVMIIENAERFGLSQLHQLRGRVGRGSEQSFCILVTKDHVKFELAKKGTPDEEKKANIIRLKTMEETTDGFEISEVDLRLRGPGDVLGTRQSGLPEFKFIDLVTDGAIITIARKEAFGLIEEDPHLRKIENTSIRAEYLRLYQGGKNYFDIA